MKRLVSLALLSVLVPLAARAEPPERIVSVGGSVTEILYALGQGDRVIAVDSTSLYPAEAQDLPQVGYVRALAAEPIIALEPDLVLAEADAGPPAVLQQMSEAGLKVELVPDRPSADGVGAKVRAVAEAAGQAERGSALAGGVDQAFADLAKRRDGLSSAPGVLFLLSHSGAPLAAGRGTSADAIIRLAGGRNVMTDFAGYKPLSPEMAVLAAPDVLLLTTQGLDQIGGLSQLSQDPALVQTPAVRDGRVYAYDALLLLGFGPRTPEVAGQLMRDLHGETTAAD